MKLCLKWNISLWLSYKVQTIVPIHKKGPKTRAENFRNVSLTGHEIKIMERVLRREISDHLERNNLINFNQHGFRRKHSCSTQLLSHMYYILSNVVEGKEIDSIYIDFAKAFDKVDHGLLIQKLKFYGISDTFLTWISNFLSNRTQTVLINNHHSYPTSVQSGVPQGSVLGPLLFIIYINDLIQAINNPNTKIFTFADDTKLVSPISSTSDQVKLQHDLNCVINWTKLNNMQLNKTKFELISHKLVPDNPNLALLKEMPFYWDFKFYATSCGFQIYPSSQVRDLGIFLDSKIDWRYHYNNIVAKAKQISGWILNTFYTRNKHTMLLLFNSLVRSKLEYCSEVWNPHLLKDINFIEKVQRTFTSRIHEMKDLDYWERLANLNIMSLQRRRERLIITHVWKIKNEFFPNSINLKFKLHERSGAIKAVLKPLPKIRGRVLSLHEESFIVNAPKLWNVLPAKLTKIDTLSSFSSELNKFLAKIPDKPPLPGYPYSNNNSLTVQCP